MRRAVACAVGWFLFWAMPVFAQEPGQRLYSEHCAVCHGSAGEGGSGPDLSNSAWHAAVGESEIDRLIAGGRGAMPAFGGRLDQAARKALIAHLRALSAQGIQPASPVKAPSIAVSAEQLLNAEKNNSDWLMYGRDYGNRRHSPLRQIHKGNVRDLVPAWSFQTGTPDGLEATPLVVNGVMYMTASWNHVFAIDARTGAELWHYRRRLPEKLKYCCGPVNRGVAVLGGLLYLATLDAHLVALDAQTGRVRWDVEMGRVEDNLSATSPPLIAGGKVVVGIAGGDFPSRCFLDAYDPATGARLWRFYTVPARGEPAASTWSEKSHEIGGGATWMNGSYDPELNLIYWGTGNPYPDFDGDARRGDNLYTNCVLAIDADSGKLRWHYQFTPGDVWDYDGVNEMVFAVVRHEGRMVKALLHADRNGHVYAIDRRSGKFLYAKPFVRVTWTKGFDAEGRPMVDPASIPTYEGVRVCPGAAGGKEWNASAYDPVARLLFLPVIENCAMFYNYGQEAQRRGLPAGPNGFRYIPNEAYGKVMALRANTFEVAWEVRTRTPMATGMLVTAGGLLFTGDAEGNFLAYDSATGQKLWSYQTGSGMRAAPVTYELDGQQYVVMPSGMGGAVGGYTGAGAPWMKSYRSGNTVYAFRLFNRR
jgi:alcohol dehydrogenase (cytochrome c)